MHKSVVVARAELVRETRSLPLLTDSIVILSGNNVPTGNAQRCS